MGIINPWAQIITTKVVEGIIFFLKKIRGANEIGSSGMKNAVPQKVDVQVSPGKPDTDEIFREIMKENGYPAYKELASRILKIETTNLAQQDFFY